MGRLMKRMYNFCCVVIIFQFVLVGADLRHFVQDLDTDLGIPPFLQIMSRPHHMAPGKSRHSWQEGFGGDQIAFPHIGFESSELEEEAGAFLAEGGMQDIGKHSLLQFQISIE